MVSLCTVGFVSFSVCLLEEDVPPYHLSVEIGCLMCLAGQFRQMGAWRFAHLLFGVSDIDAKKEPSRRTALLLPCYRLLFREQANLYTTVLCSTCSGVVRSDWLAATEALRLDVSCVNALVNQVSAN